MINIYSIKEIVEASNNILKRPIKNNISTSKKKSDLKMNPQGENDHPYLLTDPVEIKEDKKKIFSEATESKLLKTANNINQNLNVKQYIDEIYIKLNKKIKKNSLKLIFDQQSEISKLRKSINNLKEKNRTILDQQTVLKQKINELQNLKEAYITEKESLNIQIENLKIKQSNSEDQIKLFKKEKFKLLQKIDEYKTQHEINKQKIYDISDTENKNKFFQEENIRISSELVEIKKKHDILKKEIEKYENQKSNLISKINSVNEALTDTNILTNVFENKVQNKINIIDHNKIETEISQNLDEKIKNIFIKKD